MTVLLELQTAAPCRWRDGSRRSQGGGERLLIGESPRILPQLFIIVELSPVLGGDVTSSSQRQGSGEEDARR